MTTRYQCKGCQEIFEGFDPTPFGEAAIIIYPLCPRADLLIQAVYAGSATLDGKGLAADKIESEHEVGLAVVAVAEPVKAPPKIAIGAWGKPLAIKPETPEEAEAAKERSEREALRMAREKAEAEADATARKLVQRMEIAMVQKEGGVSAMFPLDLAYGTKSNGSQYAESADIITRASVYWLQKGADYGFRAAKLKPKWGQWQANFEKLIVSGDAAQGKHNFHVVRR